MTTVIGPQPLEGHTRVMASRLPLAPPQPERICWGCDRYCPAEQLACGNGTIRAPHPAELFGPDWLDWIELRDASRDPATAETE